MGRVIFLRTDVRKGTGTPRAGEPVPYETSFLTLSMMWRALMP